MHMIGGLSTCNGILLYDSSKEGVNAVYGCYNNGEIVLMEDQKSALEKVAMAEQEPYRNTFKEFLCFLEAVVLLVALTAAARSFGSEKLLWVTRICSIAGFLPVWILLYSFQNCYRSRALHRQFRRFHGCEHLLVNYYISRDEKSTACDPDDLKASWIFHPECGIAYCGYLLFLVIEAGWLLYHFSNIGLLASIGIVVGTFVGLILLILIPLNPFKLLQLNVVAQPSEHELELGMAVLNRLHELRTCA